MNQIICPRCQSANLSESKFCSSCGAFLLPVTELPQGVKLRDRYTVIRSIGKGAFGRTYLAEDANQFNTKVVIKELSPGLEGTQTMKIAQQLFQREAKTLSELMHPQIPRFWEIFEHDKRLFLIQDFIPGKTYQTLLLERIQQGRTFSESEALELLEQILPVLNYIHSQGIIHRDISPDNIIRREPDYIPILIDLGGVKQISMNVATLIATGSVINENNISQLNTPGTRLGKVGYSPDEQLNMGLVSHNSDLYALGATLLCLLTGKQPQQLRDPQTGEWNWEQEIKLETKLNQALQKMLALRPYDRFQSVSDLQNFLHPPVPPQTTLHSTPTTNPKINKWWILSGIGGAILTGLGVAFGIWINSKSSPPPAPLGEDGVIKVGIVTFPLRNTIDDYDSFIKTLETNLESQLGTDIKIEIEKVLLNQPQSSQKIREQIIAKKWDLAFTGVPQFSIVAKDNNYKFVARMNPNQTQIESALYVRSDSPIKSQADLTTNTTIALGDFNSPALFYIPAYDLYGRALNVDLNNNSSREIMNKVLNGKVDIGVGIYRTINDQPDKFRIISRSRAIPLAGVYISPKLSPQEQELITKTMLEMPNNIQRKANYGPGQELDYTSLVGIIKRVDQILSCTDWTQQPVKFYCDAITGKVNGFNQQDATNISLTLQADNGDVYRVILPENILKQIPDINNPSDLNNKRLKIQDVDPIPDDKLLQIKINNQTQIKIIE